MTAQAVPYARRRSQSKRDHMQVRRPSIVPMILFIGAVVAVFFAMIFLRVSLDETAFELDELETNIKIEQSRQLDLRYELAGLQDPLRIAGEAERIGLVYPETRVAIVVDSLAIDPQVLEPEVPIRALNESGS